MAGQCFTIIRNNRRMERDAIDRLSKEADGRFVYFKQYNKLDKLAII